MSEEQDYIVVTVGENDSSNNEDDDDFVVVDSDSESTENSDDDSMPTTKPNFQGNNDKYQPRYGISHGIEGLANPSNQLVSRVNRPENLRFNPNSGEVEFIPSYRNIQFSNSKEDDMGNTSDTFCGENQYQLVKLECSCEGLQDLIKSADRQVNQLCGIISKMKQICENPTLSINGNCSSSLPVQRQENHASWTNPVGTSLQSAVLPELQQPVLRESLPLSKTVPMYSLKPHYTLDSLFSGLAILSCFCSEGAKSTSSVISSSQPLQQQFCHNENPAAAPQEYYLVNTPEMMNYSNLMENNSMRPNAALTSLYNPLNSEMPKIAETSLENNTETMNNLASLGNDGAQCSSSLYVCPTPNFGEKFMVTNMPGKEKTGLENSSQTMQYPASLGNVNGPDTDPSPSLPPNFEMQSRGETRPENGAQIMYHPALFRNNSSSSVASSALSIPRNFEMVVGAGTNSGNNIQMVNNPPLMENDSDQNDSCVSIPTNYALLPIEILVKAGENMDNSHEMMTCPTVEENNSSQNSSSSTDSHPNSGFLGNPERNVKVLNFHLMVAQRKAEPKLAARYLARILFSKDVLVCSTAGVTSRTTNLGGRQLLDPNKMAAMREYLAKAFPNHDLREYGRDWKTCISYINSLIRYVCSDSKRVAQKNVAHNKVPTNTNTLASAYSKEKDDDDDKSSSQLSQQAAASETGANVTSQQNRGASFERFKQHSTFDREVPFETVYYLGNPRRNVRIPFSVLTIAKAKASPELSARYLVRKLFAEEILMKSFQGNLASGICALSLNAVNALQEFLQENYPNCDLTESGYDWKSCVTAINSCIRSIRYEFNKSAAISESRPATTPSAK